MKAIAIIPARSGSKRLPNKNSKLLLGKPLLAWTIEFAIEAKLFDKIILSTDSIEYADVGARYGIANTSLRPYHLSNDTASSVDVAAFELNKAEMEFGHFDALALLQPTSPWRQLERWTTAFNYLSEPSCNAVVGVKPAMAPPQHAFTLNDDNRLTALFPDALSTRTQDLPKSVYINGALYLIKRDSLLKKRSFFPPNTRAIVCDEPCENIDIDTQKDFEDAEFTLAKFHKDQVHSRK